MQLNLSRLGLGLVALVAFGTAAAGVGESQTPPGPASTPPPPPAPNIGGGNPANSGTTAAPVLVVPNGVSPSPIAPAAIASAIATAAPSSSAAPARRGRRNAPPSAAPNPNASPTDTPEPPQFTTMDGVWEIEEQPLDKKQTIYSHLQLTQTGGQITGFWLHDNNKKTPLTGTFDGRLFAFTTSDGKSTVTMSGYAENFSDLVGLLRVGDNANGTAFTGQHRKKEKAG